MESQFVLGILAMAGVVSVLLYALKGLLDQIPDVIRAWRRVVHEARRSPTAQPDEPRDPSVDPDGR